MSTNTRACRGGRVWNGVSHGKCAGLKIPWPSAFESSNLSPCKRGYEMKVVMYMAVTPNGMVARENDDTSFVLPGDWLLFIKKAKSTGNMIVGHKTFNVIVNEGELKRFRGVRIVVMTHNKTGKRGHNQVSFASGPREALSILKKEGFSQALVAGGGASNAAFMQNGLVDEIFLDVEPAVFTKGKRLFDGPNFEAKLKLLWARKISKSEVQLRYRVLGRSR